MEKKSHLSILCILSILLTICTFTLDINQVNAGNNYKYSSGRLKIDAGSDILFIRNPMFPYPIPFNIDRYISSLKISGVNQHGDSVVYYSEINPAQHVFTASDWWWQFEGGVDIEFYLIASLNQTTNTIAASSGIKNCHVSYSDSNVYELTIQYKVDFNGGGNCYIVNVWK